MTTPQKLGLKGNWTIQVIGPDGKVKQEIKKSNLIVNDGLDWIKDYCFNSATSETQMVAIAIGSSGTAETATDTALGSELARAAFDNYTAGGTGVATVDKTFAAGTGTGTVAEAGVLDNATSGGTLFNRVTFTGVVKTASDSLKVSVTFTFADA